MSSCSDSFVVINKDSMSSCSIVNIQEEEMSTDNLIGDIDAAKAASAVDPKVVEYFKLVRGVSHDDSASMNNSAPASLAQLAARACEQQMDRSASEQWAEWSTAFKSNLDADASLGQLATTRVSSLPAAEPTVATGDPSRNCQSLETGIELGARVLAEAINSVATDTDNENELEPFNEAVPNDMSALETYLRAVREENERLKKVVEQNNEAMKKQLRIVQSWQEEVASTRAAYAQLQAESESVVAKLKEENEMLKEKHNAGVKSGDESGSFIWDSMSSELGAMKSKLDRVPMLEASLNEKEIMLEECQKKLAAARAEVKAMNLQVAELRIARIKEQEANDEIKKQLELLAGSVDNEEKLRKAAEDEVKKLEAQVSELLEENAALKEKVELGTPVVNISTGESGHHSRRGHRHHKKHMRRLSDNIVAGVGAGLVLESFRQYRAT